MHLTIANLTGGGLSGGYTKYLRTLVPLIEQHPQVTRITNYVPSPLISGLEAQGVANLRGYHPRDGLLGFRCLAHQIAAQRPDAVFVPTARWLDCGMIPTVVMVRNMEPLVTPVRGNSPGEAGRNIVRALVARRACVKADRVVAVSRFVRDYVQDRWRIPADKIGVVYHGVTSPEGAELDRPDSLRDLGGEAFFFTAGSIRPARGLDDAVRAMGVLGDRGARLVVAGDIAGGANRYYRRMRALAQSLGVESRIHWAGQLSPGEMAWCYRNAALFIMTSRVEACPNTALEALSCACLCVSTTCAPMPEFFGDAARYYTPSSISQLTTAIEATIHASAADAQNRRRLMLDIAARFQWSRTAERTIEEIRKAVDS